MKQSLGLVHERFASELDQALDVISEIDGLIDGTEVHSPSIRQKLSMICYSLVISHHNATITLLQHGHYASAAALMRVHLDSYVRGCWLQIAATDAEINAFLTGKTPTFSNMIDSVERHPAFNEGVLSNVKARTWKNLSDFAHTGVQQLSRNFNGEQIDHNYELDELFEILNASQAYALLAASQIMGTVGNLVAMERLLCIARERQDV